MDYDDSRIRCFIGQFILRERKRRNWSQEALARDLGIHIDTLRNIEKGRLSARLSYYCLIALKLFDFDLQKFIINIYFSHARQHDYANLPWLAKYLIDLCYRQTNHDQQCYLIIDHLKNHPVTKAHKTRRRIRSEAKSKLRSEEMDRRSTLFGLGSGAVSGPALTENLQNWLTALDKNSVVGQNNLVGQMGKLSLNNINILKRSSRQLYESSMRFGGGDTSRRIALALLHEVSVALKEKQMSQTKQALYNIMAGLAHIIAMLSWHSNLERSAQNYYQLAMRAAHAGQDSLFAARILVDISWQMCHLNKAQDGLNLINLAIDKSGHYAGPQLKALLYMHKAWAYAALGEENDFKRAIGLSEDCMAQIITDAEPFWVRHCDQGTLTGMNAGSLRLLAIHKPKKYAEQASEINEKAISLRKQLIHSYTAQDYLGLAESRFLLKDTELAINASNKALSIYQQLDYSCGATQRRLHSIYQYSKHSAKSNQQQALNQKLKSVLALV